MANEKSVSGMFHLTKSNIVDQEKLADYKIDAIVNAAKPTLMGSENEKSVDYAVHAAVNAALPNGEKFKDKICEYLNTKKIDNMIRCERGRAVCTPGYGLCEYIIHVVGICNDGEGRWIDECSSSRIQILESCYYEIVERIKERPDIKNVAIPIIGAGEYKVSFEVAVRVAIASIGNALVEWKSKDSELFETAGLENIYLYIYHDEEWVRDKNFETAVKIWKEYERTFKLNKKVVFQSSARAHLRYLLEISRYDNERGYFAIAKSVRLLLMAIRTLFLPVMLLKDLFGRKNWENRRRTVEWTALVKMLIPFVCFWIWNNINKTGGIGNWFKYIIPILLIYNMWDTISYLLCLIVLTDIQRPSANIVRSMLMLVINYVEVIFEAAFLYCLASGGKVTFYAASLLGIFGEEVKGLSVYGAVDESFKYINMAIRFFFVSLVFGYLANHMKQRKFIS